MVDTALKRVLRSDFKNKRPGFAHAAEFEEMELKAAALVKAVLLTLEKRV